MSSCSPDIGVAGPDEPDDEDVEEGVKLSEGI